MDDNFLKDKGNEAMIFVVCVCRDTHAIVKMRREIRDALAPEQIVVRSISAGTTTQAPDRPLTTLQRGPKTIITKIPPLNLVGPPTSKISKIRSKPQVIITIIVEGVSIFMICFGSLALNGRKCICANFVLFTEQQLGFFCYILSALQ